MHKGLALITALIIGVSSCRSWQNYESNDFHHSSRDTSQSVFRPNTGSMNNRQTDPPTGCGYRNIGGISNGYYNTVDDFESNFGEFPWVVAIFSGPSEYCCGGSLITPKVVLTTYHNIEEKPMNQLKVRAGEWDRSATNEPLRHQERRVTHIQSHHDYEFEEPSPQFDIALMFLETEFALGPNINTICLPPAGLNFDRKTCISTGWGKADFRSRSNRNILKKIELPVVPNRQCQSNLNVRGLYFQIHPSFMCAGGELNLDMCTGDGGSPLVCPIEGTRNRYYLAGIVSWGMRCGGENMPGVYTKVSYLRSWIDNYVSQRRINSSSYTP